MLIDALIDVNSNLAKGRLSCWLRSGGKQVMSNQKTGGVWDQLAGQWKQFKGNVKKDWGKLTDDDLEQIAGKRDIMAGKVQERYGYAKEEANRKIDEWANKLKF